MKYLQGNHDRVIPYRPQLKAFFGSSNAAILYAQLEYWFAKNRGESFYKFNAPCDQPKYKVGDSLREELAFSDEEIEKASKRICRMFKSKKEFDQAADKFDGMPMCCYYDRVAYTKFYFRNHEICDYINSKDSDELPVFQDTRSVDQSVINGVLESVKYGSTKPQIAGSILYLYKRLQQKITQNFENEVSGIAESDTKGAQATMDFEMVNGSSKENVRKQNEFAKPMHAYDLDGLKVEFEKFRVAYREMGGSVNGLDKEFEAFKKKHAKKWHEIVPQLMPKLLNQKEQLKAQLEHERFAPRLPMLSRYLKDEMWDRHYYTIPQKAVVQTLPKFTEDQLKVTPQL
jgi:hypothetical protein